MLPAATDAKHLRFKGSWNGSSSKGPTMRALILILIVVVVAVLIAIGTGFLNISQTREAKAPQVTATRNGVTAKGGQSPAFDVATGSVKVGTKQTTVRVPALEVEKPGQSKAATNNAM
jgi:flagellar basal body-associated protein FliL